MSPVTVTYKRVQGKRNPFILLVSWVLTILIAGTSSTIVDGLSPAGLLIYVLYSLFVFMPFSMSDIVLNQTLFWRVNWIVTLLYRTAIIFLTKAVLLSRSFYIGLYGPFQTTIEVLRQIAPECILLLSIYYCLTETITYIHGRELSKESKQDS